MLVMFILFLFLLLDYIFFIYVGREIFLRGYEAGVSWPAI